MKLGMFQQSVGLFVTIPARSPVAYDSMPQLIQMNGMAQPIAGKIDQEASRGSQRSRDARWRKIRPETCLQSRKPLRRFPLGFLEPGPSGG